jgi:hypothetical protein
MMQKRRNRQVKAGIIILFICLGMIGKAQTNGFEIVEPYGDDDNKWYFQDISFEAGSYIPTTIGDLSTGFITNLSSGYYFNHWFGVRSGVSVITDLDDYSSYMKIPCLITFRTPTVRLETLEVGTLRDGLVNLFLLFLPTRFEFNIGPSLGYVRNAQHRFASSIDANLRMGFQFWRIVIHGNMGVNYLWTKNFVDRDIIRGKRSRPAWYANLSVGASFRF